MSCWSLSVHDYICGRVARELKEIPAGAELYPFIRSVHPTALLTPIPDGFIDITRQYSMTSVFMSLMLF